ncbi:hypothetical protein VPH35_101916 [Triticum aestivum]
MWRSFLARSQPLLSHLRRPSGCSTAAGDTLVAAALGGAHPRAYASGAVTHCLRRGGIRTSTLMTSTAAVSGMDSAGRASQQTMPPRRLPEPVIRLGNSSVGSKANIAAVGSKIVVTGKTHHRYGDIIITLVYDTKMARLDNQEPPPASFRLLPRYRWCDCQRAVAVGNKLYMFDYGCSPPHYLCQQQGVEFRGGYFTQDEDETMLDMRGQTMEWIWKNGPSFPGQEELRFVHPVQSHAVHPDGRTIFVSCFGDPNNHCKAPFTFSLDTKHGVDLDTVQDTEHAGDLDTGHAYYDGHLDAWVGIRMVSGREKYSVHTGCKTRSVHTLCQMRPRVPPRHPTPYLCSCDVPNLTDDHGDPPTKPLPAPEWRTCKEELTFLDGASGHALVHTGRGRFCLVEAKPVVPLYVGGEPNQCNRCTMYHDFRNCCGPSPLILTHVTMFCAKHGKDGELMIAPCRPGRSYLVPNYCQDAAENPPIAFWM